MFGLFIFPQGTVVQKRRGRDPNEGERHWREKILACRLVHLPTGVIAQAMIDRGNRVLDGGWSYNRTETPEVIHKRMAKARVTRGSL